MSDLGRRHALSEIVLQSELNSSLSSLEGYHHSTSSFRCVCTKRSCDSFALTVLQAEQYWLQRLSKYDFLSTGLGAAAVTSVCVAQGQDPFFALWLTFCATVAALVRGLYRKMQPV